MPTETAATNLVTADALLQNWQGHRRLTRRTIEAFPEDKLFTFSLGGMRTFGQMAQEMTSMAIPVVEGVLTGKWGSYEQRKPETKTELLRLWDQQTEQLNEKFPPNPARTILRRRKSICPVGDAGHRHHPIRHRQRNPSSRRRLRLPPRPRHRAPTFLGTQLAPSD